MRWLLFLIPILLLAGCQESSEGPDPNLQKSGKKFFRAYVNSAELSSGPQCLFLSPRLLKELENKPNKYCQEEIQKQEVMPPGFIKTRISVVNRFRGRAELALVVCARAPQGWIAQPPFFFFMEKINKVWLADSLPGPLLSPPSDQQKKAGIQSMKAVLEIPACRDQKNWGSDQWFSYRNL